MCSGGGAPSPRNTFFASWRRAHLPLGTLFLRPGGAAVGFAPRSGLWEGAGRRSTGNAPLLPPGGRSVPSAPLNSPSRPCPAPLNTLAPPPPAPQNPRLFRPRPAPGPTAERAGPLPVGAPETSPEGPQHAPESPFRGHLSKSRPRSWVFRGIFRTFGCKWMQKMSFAANNIIRIS